MEDRESGSLKQKPALDLLVELHHGSVTGSLKLERAPLQKAVYFRDGQILFAASNDPKDQLASILVEEGKLGPDQMQVAQARVSPGNPLAKVLTELGYISQRELADAARIKVEKILTDLYSWKEGTYQFLTKSLPKGAIDLDLSTARLLFASIRRVQDRDWVLALLGSLESVLTPTTELERFVAETHADPLSAEVLRLADGVKSVKQIGAVSSLGEFEVCKVLAAALVVGAVIGGPTPVVAANEDAFSFPSVDSSFGSATAPSPGFGMETLGLPASEPAEQEPISYDTIFQAASKQAAEPVEDNERTVFEPSPLPRPSPPSVFPPRPSEARRGPAASQLLIDEPEPETSDDSHSRRAPRPKKMRTGGGSGGGGGLLKWLGAAVLAGAAGFAVYTFVWPLVFPKSGGGKGATTSTSTSMSTTTAAATATGSSATTPSGTIPSPLPSGSATPTGGPVPSTTPTSPTGSGSGTADPRATSSSPSSASTAGTPTPVSASPTTSATPTPTTSAPRPTTSVPPTTAPSGAPKPPPPTPAPTSSGGTSSGGGRALLQSGKLDAAARAFQKEILSTGSKKFTIALGLYCNLENAGRIVDSAGGSSDIYVLPASIQGRSCYRVVWGLFESPEAAERGMGSLPSGVHGGDAAVVAISRFLQ
jgi:Domain of unknown function (DUF4388)/SPOR domain